MLREAQWDREAAWGGQRALNRGVMELWRQGPGVVRRRELFGGLRDEASPQGHVDKWEYLSVTPRGETRCGNAT